MITSSKWLAIVAVAFVAGSFIASPELRAYAVRTITSQDIVNETIQSVDIKDGDVMASEIATDAVGSNEIATDAVGASEIAGATKLIFAQCSPTVTQETTIMDPGDVVLVECSIAGVELGDSVIVTLNNAPAAFEARNALILLNDVVTIPVENESDTTSQPMGNVFIAVIVYDM
jgi:hypothetical protein